MADAYVVADLLLNLIAVGIRRDAIHARIESEKAKGTPPEKIPALLVEWRDAAIAEAQKASGLDTLTP